MPQSKIGDEFFVSCHQRILSRIVQRSECYFNMCKATLVVIGNRKLSPTQKTIDVDHLSFFLLRSITVIPHPVYCHCFIIVLGEELQLSSIDVSMSSLTT